MDDGFTLLDRAEPVDVSSAPAATLAEEEARLLALEAAYCSHGDTVHYTQFPKIFSGCEGSFMLDAAGNRFLDLQMWYSAVNFGYGNQSLNNALKRQIDTLPQVASRICTARRSSSRR